MRDAIILIFIATLICTGCSVDRVCNCKPLNESGAMPDENGVTVNQWLCKQVGEAQQGKGMIYQADWVGKSDRLSPFGRKTLSGWTRLTGTQPSLYIETSGDPYLDSQRQAAVSGYLGQIGLALPPESIRLANAESGLAGEEVPAIADRFLSELNSQGDAAPGNFSGFSGGQQGGGLF
ncbi:hypothetical protein N9Y42_02990 [Mariniblastus sp.]|nr:hypothetical protein [Mariniblastus sp.]